MYFNPLHVTKFTCTNNRDSIMQKKYIEFKAVKIMYQEDSVKLFLDVQSQNKLYELYASASSLLESALLALNKEFNVALHVENILINSLLNSSKVELDIAEVKTVIVEDRDINIALLKALVMAFNNYVHVKEIDAFR